MGRLRRRESDRDGTEGQARREAVHLDDIRVVGAGRTQQYRCECCAGAHRRPSYDHADSGAIPGKSASEQRHSSRGHSYRPPRRRRSPARVTVTGEFKGCAARNQIRRSVLASHFFGGAGFREARHGAQVPRSPAGCALTVVPESAHAPSIPGRRSPCASDLTPDARCREIRTLHYAAVGLCCACTDWRAARGSWRSSQVSSRSRGKRTIRPAAERASKRPPPSAGYEYIKYI